MHSVPLEAEGLGTPVGEYRAAWWAALLGWGGSALVSGAALWFSVRSPTGTWWTTLLFGGLTLVLLVVAARSVYAALNEQLLIFSDGLFQQRRRSGERFAWSDIKQMKWELGQHQGIAHLLLVLIRSDGEEFVLDGAFVSLPKRRQRVGPFRRLSLPEAIVEIEEAVRPALCRQAIAQYEAGATADFGAVRVSRRGLQTDAGELAWPAVADIEEESGALLVSVAGEEMPRLQAAIKTILNPFALVALLDHIGPNRWTLTTQPEPAIEQPFGKVARRRRWAAVWPWLALILLFGGRWGYGKYDYAISRPGQLEHAMNLYADQRYAESIAVLDPLIVEEPGYVMGHIHRGRAYHKLGQFERAMANYQQAISLKPGYWYAIYNRGRLYDDMGRADEALRDYAQALALKPDLGYAFYKRGNLYARIGMKEAAISDLETYLTFPDDLEKHAEVRQTLSELRR